MSIRDKRLANVPYRLNPFTFCHTFNDRVRCASLTRGRNEYYYQKFIEKKVEPHTHLPNSNKEVFINQVCARPLLAIRKWKWWLRRMNRTDRDTSKLCYPMAWIDICDFNNNLRIKFNVDTCYNPIWIS